LNNSRKNSSNKSNNVGFDKDKLRQQELQHHNKIKAKTDRSNVFDDKYIIQLSKKNSNKSLKNILSPANEDVWGLMAQQNTHEVSVYCPRKSLNNGWISSKTFATIDLPIEAMVAAVCHKDVLQNVFTTVEKRYVLHEIKSQSDENKLVSLEQLIIQLPFFSKRDMLLLIRKEWISSDQFVMTQHSFHNENDTFNLPQNNLVRMTVEYEGTSLERFGNKTKCLIFEQKCIQANIPGFILKQGVRQRLVEIDKLVHFARELMFQTNQNLF
jgi:hypothetical protein